MLLSRGIPKRKYVLLCITSKIEDFHISIRVKVLENLTSEKLSELGIEDNMKLETSLALLANRKEKKCPNVLRKNQKNPKRNNAIKNDL